MYEVFGNLTFEDARGPQANEDGHPLEAGRDQKQVVP